MAAQGCKVLGAVGTAPAGWTPVRQAMLACCLATLAAAAAQAAESAALPEEYGRFQFEEYEREHWAFLPFERPEAPAVSAPEWVHNPIDAFILSALDDAQLEPAPAADPRTLLRRVFLDLIGLPPTPEEQQSFLADRSPDAYARVVDDLLARPAYGERWGRHWLDVVRYAESNGYERDGAKPQAWRYRDYVIDAFNRDMPYDQFLREQLAGDELEGSTARMQVATTMLRLGPWDDEPADPEVDRYDQLDDVLGTVAAVFMAQTVRCARCHDHKFESFTQRDYYRMLAVFEPLKRPQDGRTDLDYPVGAAEDVAAWRRQNDEVEQMLTSLKAQIELAQHQAVRRLLEAGQLAATATADGAAAEGGATADGPNSSKLLPPEALTAVAVPPPDRNEDQRKLVEKYASRLSRLLDSQASEEEKAKLAELAGHVTAAEAARPTAPLKAYVFYEEAATTAVTHVFRRGDPRAPLEEVHPGVPAILVDEALPAAQATSHSSGRRRQLAEWLAQADHPLTARVMVNRLWQHHFGDGLVGSESDFGVMGEAPTHPELLDWLAAEFVSSGWSSKHMQRLIVLSNTYRMSSAENARGQSRDPHNEMLCRFPPRRLEAEAVRDCMLAASGQLNRRMAGPSVFPSLAAEVLASQSRPGNGWTESPPLEAARRSIYVFVKRTLPVPELEVLDFPDTNNSCEQRPVSTVAPQALTFLNGAFVHEQSRHFADRLAAEAADTPQRIERAYLLALARLPSDQERAAVADFLVRQEQLIAEEAREAGQPIETAARDALQAFCLVLLNTNEFFYLR